MEALRQVTLIDSLLSNWDPGAQGSQVETLKAKQPGVVLLKITGVGVRLVTFSMRVVFTTAGVSVVWLTAMPARRGHRMIQSVFDIWGQPDAEPHRKRNCKMFLTCV